MRVIANFASQGQKKRYGINVRITLSFCLNQVDNFHHIIMEYKKQIFVKCFKDGVFTRLGATCSADTPIIDFVSNVFETYSYKDLLISTVRCFVFRPDTQERVQICNTDFLENREDLFVSSSSSEAAMLKEVKKQCKKLQKKESTKSSTVKDESECVVEGSGKRKSGIIKKPYRAKTTMDRFKDHMQNKSSPTYNK
tara:strand:+ start:63 stop:650 length:588 start_codon:yes stop_codon:yes gene_type:complete